LRFNHSCQNEKLLPRRTGRGHKLIRKQGIEFLKFRITECHIKSKELKNNQSQLLETLKQQLSVEHNLQLAVHSSETGKNSNKL